MEQHLKSSAWYRLPFTPVYRSIEEQWRLTIPEDGADTHRVHYRPADGKTDSVRILIRQEDGSWEETQCEEFGSCLVFKMTGREAEIAVVSILSVWWQWLLLGIVCLTLLCLLLWLVFRLIRAICRKSKLLLILPAALLLIGAAAAAYFLIGNSAGLTAYRALEKLDHSREFSMQLSVRAEADDIRISETTALQKKTQDMASSGTKASWEIFFAQVEDVPVYYTDGVVILENGRAFRLSESFPDYSSLVKKLLSLYKEIKTESTDDGWQIQASGDTAKQLLDTVLPQLSESLNEDLQLTATVKTRNFRAERICLRAQGTWSDGETISVETVMEDITDSADFEIPEAVEKTREAVFARMSGSTGGENGSIVQASTVAGKEELPVITGDVLTLWNAWRHFREKETVTARIDLSADCGPVVVNQTLQYSAKQQKKETDAAEEGKTQTQASELLNIAYTICLNGEFSKEEREDSVNYTVQLDGDTMKEIAREAAPGTEKLDLNFTAGSLSVAVKDGDLQSIRFECTGKVKVAVLDTPASLGGIITFTEE